ncbi:SDR family oxidoreductase [Leptolyngbya sp. FACHB-261]|uniref:SDR family oxidoreductase n=1 Tax=Leptolyngbya sp. FACHB-261 TaxID=2692806 RepID=UPI00168A10F1|nr:SDR family oxidoreductase [Leptolyngbya sp. FACHB-261]MBD2104547.1 SDR family oxidoreductase [Leptolyngbya sp. FACHB-261]
MGAPYIFLAGASRGVGLEIARCLSQQQYGVKALLRHEAARTQLEALGITVAIGDALDVPAVEQAMLGDTPIETVISTIGGLPQDGKRADYLGNRNLIDAARKVGAKRFILISSIGAGNSAIAIAPHVLETLATVLAEKEKAENHLIASGLVYTIIRPGGLQSGPATGNGLLTEDPAVAGSIYRADVAQLVCQCLTSERANNKVLSAVDRQMLYGQPVFEEFQLS